MEMHGGYYKQMIVTSFPKVIPPKNNSTEKENILKYFIQGVQAVGDTGRIHNSVSRIDTDVAIIQGWQHQRGKTAPHLQLRQDIIDQQLMRNKYVITADSNLFLYANASNEPHHYLRYSINGVFPNTGNYCDEVIDPNRWRQISVDCNIRLSNSVNKGKYILLCCQRNGGWSMGGLEVMTWIYSVCKEIRMHTDRPILIRAHPGDKRAKEYMRLTGALATIPNVRVSRFGTPLQADLMKTWCVVNHNSSSIVGPIIQGYPAFITDPERSQCAEVSHHGFDNIENPKEFDRQKWLERISMFHWKFSELQNGKAWSHMRNYCQ